MIDSLGDVGAALSGASPDNLAKLYERLEVELHYEPHKTTVHAAVSPRVVNEGVRGRTCALSTRRWPLIRRPGHGFD